jgi:putative transposase
VEIDVPRDTGSAFDPQTVKKRQRRLTGVDDRAVAQREGTHDRRDRGHFAELFCVEVSRDTEVSEDTVSRTIEKVVGEMTEWQNRLLDRVLPVMFIDAIPRQGP